MRLWFMRHWDGLRTNYWFLPAVLAITAAALARFTIQVDRASHERGADALAWAYSGGAEGARAVLSTIAGSMITVAGVVFSITIVALSLASAQFGPRLLRNFIRDRGNQLVLGTFTATFLYCLLVLRTVRGEDYNAFVPGVSVTVGIALALVNLGLLIYFIHHVSVSIQATQVIAVVTKELHETIDRLWPEELGEEPPDGVDSAERAAIGKLEKESAEILARDSGYVDAVNDEALLQLAKEHDLLIGLSRRAGHFVVRGNRLAQILPTQTVDEKLSKQINDAFILSSHRTPFQDVEFAVDQLVEIAVRALSPGINDPFTAMTCLDRLGEALCRLAQRTVPSPYRYDDEKQLRVVVHSATFEGVVDSAFNQIRQYGRTSAAVLIRMLEVLAVVANHAGREADRAALARHADLIHRAAEQGLPEKSDRKDVDERFDAVRGILADGPKQAPTPPPSDD